MRLSIIHAHKATITYTEDGHVETFVDELGLDALAYEVLDMESTIDTGVDHMHLEYTVDVDENHDRLTP